MLAFLALSVTTKSWFEARRSPYFFLRVQASRRTQKYLVISIGLILLAAATTAYAWQTPQDTTPRVAVLTHAKPVPAQDIQSDESLDAPVGLTEENPTALEISMSPVTGVASEETADLVEVDPLAEPALPSEYAQFEPTSELKDTTTIGNISFSTDISDDYQAIDAGRRFGSGFFTLYGTFDYDGMADGMVWSWLWKRNSQIIEGGNQVWSYGVDGPGYVYLRPEEGFQTGEYVLEVWINDKLFTQANFTITDAIKATN